MAYTALYRKLRPDTFRGVVGQDHIVRTLKNQIESGRISHAYLFCGTRGTGKTSTAKVFARAVNCETLVDGEPCNQCEACLAIQAQRSVNVIEIDAASNNGVDNIRDIREEVKYPPAVGTYKVYIIDEVHMLSTGAFNALLKTLEEPPEHVIFILATTDPQKIPATILSRCQRFDFRRITAEIMTETLKSYMAEENISVEEDALQYISVLSDGAMRDALSTLDQCISFYFDETITLAKVQEITGSVDNTVFFNMAEEIHHRNTEGCMRIIEEIVIMGRDIHQFVTEFIAHLRDVLVVSSLGEKATTDRSEASRNRLQAQGKEIPPEELMSYIYDFSELQTRMKYASNERIMLEVACIKLCNRADGTVTFTETSKEQSEPDYHGLNILEDRIEKLEKRLKQSIASQGSSPVSHATTNTPPVEKVPVQKVVKKAIPADFQKVLAEWHTFARSFPQPESSFLSQADAGFLQDAFLYIVCGTMGSMSILRGKEDAIREKLQTTYGVDFTLKFVMRQEYEMNHRAKFGETDDFHYTVTTGTEDKPLDMEKLKNTLNIDIAIEE